MLRFYELLVGFRLCYPLADHIVFQLRAAFCALPLMPSLQFRAEHFFAVNIGNKSLAKLLFSQTLMHNSDAAQSARKVAIV